jgi:hypothetical protein
MDHTLPIPSLSGNPYAVKPRRTGAWVRYGTTGAIFYTARPELYAESHPFQILSPVAQPAQP